MGSCVAAARPTLTAASSRVGIRPFLYLDACPGCYAASWPRLRCSFSLELRRLSRPLLLRLSQVLRSTSRRFRQAPAGRRTRPERAWHSPVLSRRRFSGRAARIARHSAASWPPGQKQLARARAFDEHRHTSRPVHPRSKRSPVRGEVSSGRTRLYWSQCSHSQRSHSSLRGAGELEPRLCTPAFD